MREVLNNYSREHTQGFNKQSDDRGCRGQISHTLAYTKIQLGLRSDKCG